MPLTEIGHKISVCLGRDLLVVRKGFLGRVGGLFVCRPVFKVVIQGEELMSEFAHFSRRVREFPRSEAFELISPYTPATVVTSPRCRRASRGR